MFRLTIIEFSVIFDEMKVSNDFSFYLFGKELFNSASIFGQRKNIIQMERGRILHSDYANLLWGSGIIGLLLYLNIFIQLIKSVLKEKKYISNNIYYSQVYTCFWMVLVGLFINGFADGILNFSARVVPFLLLGALLGVLNSNPAKRRYLSENNNEVINV